MVETVDFIAAQMAYRAVDPLQEAAKPTLFRPHPGERFLRGPIPMPWLLAASSLPGKALSVGVAIWHVAGMEKTARVRLSHKLLREGGVTRDSAYRALRRLEVAGLVAVNRHRGRSPIVELLQQPRRVHDNTVCAGHQRDDATRGGACP
jgi:DNA-binding MarR family transcriptional regulator